MPSFDLCLLNSVDQVHDSDFSLLQSPSGPRRFSRSSLIAEFCACQLCQYGMRTCPSAKSMRTATGPISNLGHLFKCNYFIKLNDKFVLADEPILGEKKRVEFNKRQWFMSSAASCWMSLSTSAEPLRNLSYFDLVELIFHTMIPIRTIRRDLRHRQTETRGRHSGGNVNTRKSRVTNNYETCAISA